MEKNQYWVTLEPIGSRVLVQPKTFILSAIQQAGVEITAVCGGKGSCGTCKVRPISGNFSPLIKEETEQLHKSELNSGLRLACRTQIFSDCTIQIPPESLATLQRLQMESVNNRYEIDPTINRLDISLAIRDVADNYSFVNRIRNFLETKGAGNVEISQNLFPALQKVLKKQDGIATLVLNEFSVITVINPDDKLLGYAVDIGTTKIAGYLVDLQTGQTLASNGVVNPQVAYGEDVISRIKYTDEHPKGAEILQKILVQAINDLLARLCRELGETTDQIVDCVMVGNTAMQHLLAGLSVHSLGTSPYIPTNFQPLYFQASKVGITIAQNAFVYLPPNIAGFVGGDHIAMLLATNARQRGLSVIALDIGTNTEISLIHQGHHLTCSCASGPAFEGAHIRYGMRAISGAIERVFIDNNTVKVQTINNSPAIGICGSGIVDAVAEMCKENLIDSRGSFNKNDSRLRISEKLVEFVLIQADESGNGQEITINRKDVNEIQLAKAAIRSGLEVLLKQAHLNFADVDLFLIAGAFGTYLDLHNTLRIGMFPLIEFDRFIQVGNAAGSGARELLLSKKKRLEGEKMVGSIEYIELTTVKDYQDIFMDAIRFADFR
jgi:uncharacterized 2Fe-2S/4Fe-4S cluster protein (DUF4445 family)